MPPVPRLRDVADCGQRVENDSVPRAQRQGRVDQPGDPPAGAAGGGRVALPAQRLGQELAPAGHPHDRLHRRRDRHDPIRRGDDPGSPGRRPRVRLHVVAGEHRQRCRARGAADPRPPRSPGRRRRVRHDVPPLRRRSTVAALDHRRAARRPLRRSGLRLGGAGRGRRGAGRRRTPRRRRSSPDRVHQRGPPAGGRPRTASRLPRRARRARAGQRAGVGGRRHLDDRRRSRGGDRSC